MYMNKRTKGLLSLTWVYSGDNKYFLFMFDFLAYQIAWLSFQLAWKKKKLSGRGHWALASCQVLSNSVSHFQRRSKGQQSFFSDRPKKHKLGRGRWDPASCQVSLNSILLFQKRSRKCLSQSQARVAILFFWSVWKTQEW